GVVSGRPQPAPRMGMLVAMVYMELLPMSLTLATGTMDVPYAANAESSRDEPHPGRTLNDARPLQVERHGSLVEVQLYRLAYARSGDKGNHANIGVIARKAEYWPYLLDFLSSDRVFQHFRRYFSAEVQAQGAETSVQRWELPGIKALNFMLKNSLGGGGMASLRADAQGKSFGQMLLQINIPMPREFL
ncbi:MAG: hypothetical protein M3Q07_18895, partial [Pseudobdellovibrionaceae bacterium]|nr:hypothetical protein [Pseudobdellovibrionaceae bacterium]